MARNSNATTVTELIHELEAINEIILYTELCEKNARLHCKEYMERFAETEEEYWRDESLEQDTKADAFEQIKKLLIATAFG